MRNHAFWRFIKESLGLIQSLNQSFRSLIELSSGSVGPIWTCPSFVIQKCGSAGVDQYFCGQNGIDFRVWHPYLNCVSYQRSYISHLAMIVEANQVLVIGWTTLPPPPKVHLEYESVTLPNLWDWQLVELIDVGMAMMEVLMIWVSSCLLMAVANLGLRSSAR